MTALIKWLTLPLRGDTGRTCRTRVRCVCDPRAARLAATRVVSSDFRSTLVIRRSYASSSWFTTKLYCWWWLSFLLYRLPSLNSEWNGVMHHSITTLCAMRKTRLSPWLSSRLSSPRNVSSDDYRVPDRRQTGASVAEIQCWWYHLVHGLL